MAKLNVAVFVTSGLGAVNPSLVGEEYVDASGVRYPPKFVVPCRVLTGSRDTLRRAFDRALDRKPDDERVELDQIVVE